MQEKKVNNQFTFMQRIESKFTEADQTDLAGKVFRKYNENSVTFYYSFGVDCDHKSTDS